MDEAKGCRLYYGSGKVGMPGARHAQVAAGSADWADRRDSAGPRPNGPVRMDDLPSANHPWRLHTCRGSRDFRARV